MLRVAITRALPEAEKTALAVHACGAEALVAPLLRIEARGFDTKLDGVQALLFTSGNGVHAFADASAARDVRVLSVGDATTEAARAAGFTDVRSAEGDVEALSRLARASLDPTAGMLVHVSGAHTAGDLAADLRAAGFAAERRVAYEARAVSDLPAAFAGPLDLVLFHSARAADIFVGFGAPDAQTMAAACLSPTVAAAARAAPWARLIVAPAPREDGLLRAAFASLGAPGGASA